MPVTEYAKFGPCTQHIKPTVAQLWYYVYLICTYVCTYMHIRNYKDCIDVQIYNSLHTCFASRTALLWIVIQSTFSTHRDTTEYQLCRCNSTKIVIKSLPLDQPGTNGEIFAQSYTVKLTEQRCWSGCLGSHELQCTGVREVFN